MATGSPDAYLQSNEFYHEEDRFWARYNKRERLDAPKLVNQLNRHVLLIEEVDGKQYGVMDGVVVPSGQEFTLAVKDMSDGSIHRFPTPASFDWYQSKYFVDSSWWRRHKFMTRAARELRDHTYQLFDAALSKGVYTPEEADGHRDSSDRALRWNLGARLGMSLSSSWEDLMTRIQEM